jgi:hypothetical protein
MSHLVRTVFSAAAGLARALTVMAFACSCVSSSSKTKSAAELRPPSEYYSDLDRTMYGSSVRIEVTCAGGIGGGSGVAVSPVHVLTAWHVVECGDGEIATDVVAIKRDGERVEMKVEKRADDGVDAVRLRSTSILSLPFDVWAGTSVRVPLVGEGVCIVAGGSHWTYGIKKCGPVSEVVPVHFVVSMHVVPGNSGAAVFDENGRVIGLVRACNRPDVNEFFGVMVRTDSFSTLGSVITVPQDDI